jgi:hypothetical protein
MKGALMASRFLFAFAVLLSASAASATGYGRNRVYTGDNPWWELHSSRFTVYYEEGTELVAESTVVIAERAMQRLSSTFEHLPSQPIPVVVYRSPGRFRQTTIISGEVGEGVGGFTEFFKGRVVVPYGGVFSEYRHVLEHEVNHAFVYDMLYDRSLYGIVRSKAPLWTLEGLAEYTSQGWDIDSESEFRDMVIAGLIVPIPQLSVRSDYLVYREGQAVYHFMVQRYGEARYKTFVRHLRDNDGLSSAIREAFDMTVEQFSERFIEWARETYWAPVSTGESPSDIGSPIVLDGRNGRKRVVLAEPVLSPDGSMAAGVEVHRGRFSTVVRDAGDGREILRPISGGGLVEYSPSPMFRTVAFSPGSDSLAVAYQGLFSDGLMVQEIGGESRRLSRDFELIRDPSWNPDGGAVAFSALDNGILDIFVWEPATGRLERLTRGDGSPRDLWWGDSGILFVGERENGRVFTLNSVTPGSDPEVLYETAYPIQNPVSYPEGVVFIMDTGCGANFHLLSPETGEVTRLTSLYRTPSSLSRASGTALSLFAASDWSGAGLFITRDLSLRDGLPGECPREVAEPDSAAVPASAFNPEWRISPYDPALSIDYVSASAGFDSYAGLAGYSQFIFSDVLARHQLALLMDLNGEVSDVDAGVFYSNIEKPVQFGVSLYRQANRYRFTDTVTGDRDYVRDTEIGAGTEFRYPFTRSLRASLGASYRRLDREGLWSTDINLRENIFSITGRLVKDNALWGSTGPRVGSRLALAADWAPGLGDNASYTTLQADMRNYTWISGQVTLATRLAAGASFGENPQRFFLGGAIPHRRSTGDVEGVEDLFGFYTSYADLLRGFDYVEFNGSKYALGSLELRFPVVNQLSLAAPLPVTLTGGRGVIFTDIGTAVDDVDSFRGASTEGGYRLEDLKMGFGFGLRFNLSLFVFLWDCAWRTDLNGVSAKPEHYVTLGAEF